MSSHGEITLVIQEIAGLIKALNDLKAKHKELTEMKTCGGKIEKVDVVVKDPATGRDIGFQKTADGSYRVICDSDGLTKEQAAKQQDFVKQIRQRYSYNKVLEELRKQGYIIAEEEKMANNTVRILARKWS